VKVTCGLARGQRHICCSALLKPRLQEHGLVFVGDARESQLIGKLGRIASLLDIEKGILLTCISQERDAEMSVAGPLTKIFYQVELEHVY
jgi:hypothetical protein